MCNKLPENAPQKLDRLLRENRNSGVLYGLASDMPCDDLEEVVLEWKEEVPGLRQERCLMVAARQDAL